MRTVTVTAYIHVNSHGNSHGVWTYAERSPLKMVARHFMLSLCQLTPLNLEEPLPVGALFRALAFTVTVSPVPAALGTCLGPDPPAPL